MKRHVVYREILNHIVSLTTGLNAEEMSIISASITNDRLNDIDYDKINNALPAEHDGCKRLIKKIRSLSIDETTDVLNEDCKQYFFIPKSSIKRVYDFCHEAPDLICLKGESLFGADIANDALPLIEIICSDTIQISAFVAKLDDAANADSIVVAFNPTVYANLDSDLNRCYAFIVLQYLYDSHHINLPVELNSPSLPTTLLNYNSVAPYCQYNDIYDIINDWQHAKNLLDSFLRMYHVIEYMAYRRDVVRIETGSTIKRSFLRQIKGLDQSYQKNERSKITEGYCQLFNNAKFTNTDLTGDQTDEQFCGKYFPLEPDGSAYFTAANLSGTVQKQKKVTAKFIYDVRCMIVHSKESEFHITLTNLEEYNAIVPLMKIIIERVYSELPNILSDENNSIKFTNNTIQLY